MNWNERNRAMNSIELFLSAIFWIIGGAIAIIAIIILSLFRLIRYFYNHDGWRVFWIVFFWWLILVGLLFAGSVARIGHTIMEVLF